jgi:hypothetical protein
MLTLTYRSTHIKIEYSTLCEGLREVLSALLRNDQTVGQINSLVHRCQALAMQHLKAKHGAGLLHTSLLGLPIKDLAVDCIADLFRQIPEEGYVQLTAYFGSLSIDTMPDQALLGHLRRLVYAKVNENLARLYATNDSGLAKILRNIHLTVRSLKNFEERERFGEPCLVPSSCDALIHLPCFDRDTLENHLMKSGEWPRNVPQALALLAKYLREQNEHCRVVPLMTVAFIIRSMFSRAEVREVVDGGASDTLLKEDIMKIISRCIRHVHDRMEKYYIEKKQVNRDLYVAYLDVVRDHLVARFVQGNSIELSLYESLTKQLGSLGRQEYVRCHRATLEYLYSIAQEHTVKELQGSFGFRQRQ